jgi:Cytochrome C oxidase, cbb3-type, subunit III
VGNGVGMIVPRGYSKAGNFHTERLMSAPLGHFFSVMTNGYGSMPDYAAQITPEDRWAVAAYIRALQLSQSATEKDAAPAAKVENLSDIAERMGLPGGFAGPWEMPATAVSAKPSKEHPPANGSPADSRPDSKNKPMTNPAGQTVAPPASH